MKLLFWIFVVGILLLLSSSIYAENNQTDNNGIQHTATGKIYKIEGRNCTITYVLATWRPPALVAHLRYDQVVGQGTFSRTNW